VPLVNLDVQVTTKDGQFIPGLGKENFKIFEDGSEQKVTNFAQSGDKPITAVLLVEFASTNYYFMVDALNASYAFANTLKKDDWIAVVSYDIKPRILVDFTQDKRAVYGALGQLRIDFIGESLFQRGNPRQQPAIPRQPQVPRGRQDIQKTLFDVQGIICYLVRCRIIRRIRAQHQFPDAIFHH
jgi:VWFA-related protein